MAVTPGATAYLLTDRFNRLLQISVFLGFITAKAVGIILVIAVLIAPGAISYQLTNLFEHMIWYSIAIAVVFTVPGIRLSYPIDSAPAPTIVVLMSLIFIVVFLFAPQRGMLRDVQMTAEPEQ